jgi:hypothetical protein
MRHSLSKSSPAQRKAEGFPHIRRHSRFKTHTLLQLQRAASTSIICPDADLYYVAPLGLAADFGC